MEPKHLIVNDLRVLRLIADDIQDQNELVDTLTEPDLILESTEELLLLIKEYNSMCDKIEQKLSDYVANCNTSNEPIELGMYKFYKNFKNGKSKAITTHKR